MIPADSNSECEVAGIHNASINSTTMVFSRITAERRSNESAATQPILIEGLVPETEQKQIG